MKYLKKFETEAEYNAYEKSPLKSYVSLVGSGVIYDKGMPEGVYVQHIDGKLYTTNKWTLGGFSNDKANGVAVIDKVASFVISKDDISDSMAWSSSISTIISGVFTTDDPDIAKTDYAGKANTEIIAKTVTGKAADSCINYEFPNGQKGYLPALGEWALAYQYKNDIIATIELIGGTALSLNSATYHSSTQKDAAMAWRLNWTTGEFTSIRKNYTGCVRPFTTL